MDEILPTGTRVRLAEGKGSVGVIRTIQGDPKLSWCYTVYWGSADGNTYVSDHLRSELVPVQVV